MKRTKKLMLSLILVVLILATVLHFSFFLMGSSIAPLNINNIYLPTLTFNTDYKKLLTSEYVIRIRRQIEEIVYLNLNDFFQTKNRNVKSIVVEKDDFKILGLDQITTNSAKEWFEEGEAVGLQVVLNSNSSKLSGTSSSFEVNFRIAPVELMSTDIIDPYNVDLGPIKFRNNVINEIDLLSTLSVFQPKLFAEKTNGWFFQQQFRLNIDKEIITQFGYCIVEAKNIFFSGKCNFSFIVA